MKTPKEMTRIIEIKSCNNCPYAKSGQCAKNYYKQITGINQTTGFPDWCPLPIKEEKEEKK